MGDAEAKPALSESEATGSETPLDESAKDGSEEEKQNAVFGALKSVKDGYASFLRKRSKKPLQVLLPKGSTTTTAPSMGRGSIYTKVPPLGPGFDERDFYAVKEPYTFVRVKYNEDIAENIYEIIEPQIDEKEQKLVNLLKDTLERTVGYNWEEMKGKDNREFLIASIDSFIKSRGVHIDDIAKAKVKYYVIRDFAGFGPIDVMMNDDNIEDISCDGTDVDIFAFHRKYESIRTALRFPTDEELESFVVGLAQRCGKQLSVSSPILDGTTHEGHRVQATYSYEVTTRGSTFTMRRFKEKPFTCVDLINFHSASAEMVAYLWMAVEQGDSMMIVGGPASGKTSTLNAMMLFCPPSSKIISMEDTREVNLYHENWIPGVTRSGSGERGADGKAAGEVDMFDLVRAALRQRPNYIMVGEVRGKETYTMFQAMATGHTTYSTMHADSVKSMVNRLENPPINCPRILLSALNEVVIEKLVRVGLSEVRRITSIVEIVGFEPETNELITNTVFEWHRRGDKFKFKGHSFLFDKIMEMKNMTHEDIMAEFKRRVDLVQYSVDKDIQDFTTLASLIVSYYKEPVETIQKIRDEMGWETPEEEVEI